jgi:IclR family pca regulon transcriptional regulator
MADKERVKSLEKGLRLLVLLSRQESPLSLDEITRLSGFKKTVCFRLLQTMKDLNFVEQDSKTKNYRLGWQNISIGAATLKDLSLRRVALPFMQKLRQDTGETVNLAILEGTDIVFVERLEADHILGTRNRIGERLPVYCTCMGKAILAFMPPSRQEEIISKIDFRPLTGRTLTTPEQLRRELARVRSEGVAVNDEELEDGLCAIGAPLMDYTGFAVAALNVAFPTFRHSKEKALRNFAPAVKEASRKISTLLGYEEAGAESTPFSADNRQ